MLKNRRGKKRRTEQNISTMKRNLLEKWILKIQRVKSYEFVLEAGTVSYKDISYICVPSALFIHNINSRKYKCHENILTTRFALDMA